MATKFVLSAFVAHVSQYAAEGQRVTQAARAVRVAKAFILETYGSPWELDEATQNAADKGIVTALAKAYGVTCGADGQRANPLSGLGILGSKEDEKVNACRVAVHRARALFKAPSSSVNVGAALKQLKLALMGDNAEKLKEAAMAAKELMLLVQGLGVKV